MEGGLGDNSLATLDPVTQTILVNGPVDVTGGDGGNADASIVSSGVQTILNTNGGITLTAGPGAGADAIISSAGGQSLADLRALFWKDPARYLIKLSPAARRESYER